ncbi:MAG: OmpA family protein [Candidatus Kapaibacterium sp.]
MLNLLPFSRTFFAMSFLGIMLSSSLGAQPIASNYQHQNSSKASAQGTLDPLADKVDQKPIISVPTLSRVQGINSADRDNSPIVSADGNLLFFNSTRRGDRQWARYNPMKQRYDEDIYYAVRSPVRSNEDAWEEPINIGNTINSSEDDGVVAISPDGQKLYFNSLKKGWEQDGGPFYYARLHGRDWTEITGLGGGITQFFHNRPKGIGFRIYGGSVSSDGNDFYFATSLFSPSSKHQIWVSHLVKGEWSYPENLGPTINNAGANYAPCIAADGKTLFFCASGRSGYGGDDIFVSSLENGAWSEPVNVGEPINTPEDNSFLSIPASGDRVYLSVTRDGNEDVYVAPLPEILRPNNVVLLSGSVTDKVTGLPIEATVVIEDLQTGQTIFKANSNATNGNYTTVLQPGRDYGISINAPGYIFRSDRYTIPERTPYKEFNHPVELEKLKTGESFVVNNIFFDYNTATLDNASRPELDRIIDLMKEHGALKMQVNGHTDNVGSSDFNYKLSVKRAEAVRDYLITNGGIDSARISVKGFGYKKPVASNKSEEGRHQNRRSEFTVLQM